MSDSNGPIPVLESPKAQIQRLAHFLMTEVPGEPSEDQGAIDTAIRVIRTLQEAVARRNERRIKRVERDAHIQLLHKHGYSYAEIGREYKISRQRVEQIVLGYTG